MGCMILQDGLEWVVKGFADFWYLNSMFHLIESPNCLDVSAGNPVSVHPYIYPHVISSGEEITMYITLGDNYLLLYYNLHAWLLAITLRSHKRSLIR